MKNGLLILFGESFRLGGQGNRNIGTAESYDEQIKAAQSHLNFISHLKKNDVNMVVSINSYTTRYDNDLNTIYNDVLCDAMYHHNLIGQSGLIHTCIDRLNKISIYDFILCMRIDICLKDKFMEVFNPNSDKILFPSICFEPYHKVGIHPRVNDMMLFIPKKYTFFFKKSKFALCHDTWCILIETYKINFDDLDMMLDTYHDSDSAKDYNPIYYIVNRPENPCHHTTKIFNKHNF